MYVVVISTEESFELLTDHLKVSKYSDVGNENMCMLKYTGANANRLKYLIP